MKVLVTGGAGYIGSIVAAELKMLGNDVVIFDDLSTGHMDAVAPNIEFIQGNMLDESALNQALVGVDAVIHFSAKSLVGESVVK
ncbi:MAG: NAD-dependent epimerase/dehydratase family protein, partial [Candidatus Nanopelagicales bacterium]